MGKGEGKNERMISCLGTFPPSSSLHAQYHITLKRQSSFKENASSISFSDFFSIGYSGKNTDRKFKKQTGFASYCATYCLCDPGQTLTSIHLFSCFHFENYMPNIHIR